MDPQRLTRSVHDIVLMNPNSNVRTTDAMCTIAARALGERPKGWTAQTGPSVIVTADALEAAGTLVASATFDREPRGIIVSAFGDPGAERLKRRLPIPVVGIGAAAARAAGRSGKPFAVATTTPALGPAIDTLMQTEADAPYVGCFFTIGDPSALMADALALDAALLRAVEEAAAAGARHVVIGGGPLGEAADRMSGRAPVTLFNPITCAALELSRLLETKND